MAKTPSVKVVLRYEDMDPERPINLDVGVPLEVYRDGELHAKIWPGLDVLNVEIPSRHEPAPGGHALATSSITMRYGCGHQIHPISGDVMWPACPWCNKHLRQLWDGAEPRRLTTHRPRDRQRWREYAQDLYDNPVGRNEKERAACRVLAERVLQVDREDR